MKKVFFYLFALTSLVSCQNDLLDQDSQNSNESGNEFKAVLDMPGPSTRTVSDESNNVIWLDQDEISIFSSNNDNQEYCIKEGQGTSSAIFSYKGTEPASNSESVNGNYAVYPYSRSNSLSGSIITTNLNGEQKYESNSFANCSSIMVAHSGNEYLSFTNTVGILRLKIKKINTQNFNVNSIQVTSNHNILSGAVTIDMSSANPIAVPTNNGSKVTTIECNEPISIDNGYTCFNVILPVKDYSKDDLSVTLNFDDESVVPMTYASIEHPISIRRSAVTTLYVELSDNGANIDYYANGNEPFVDLEQVGDYNSETLWENGSINYSTGYEYTTSNRLKTRTYLSQDVDVIVLDDAVRAYLFAYENDVIVGAWNGNEFSKSSITGMRCIINMYDYKDQYPQYKFKLVMYKKEEGAVSPSDCSAIQMYNSSFFYNTFVPSVNNGKTILTFIDDDGHAGSVTSWEDINSACGVIPTFALITAKVGEPNRITWADVDRLKAKGFEFISHTHNHIKLTELNSEEIINEFTSTKAVLDQHGCNSDFIVYPHNLHSTISDALLPQYFKAGFSENNNMNFQLLNNVALARYSYLGTKVISVSDERGIAHNVLAPKSEIQFHAILDEALIKNGWMVMMCHFRNSYSDNYHYGDDIKESVIKLAKSAKNRGIKIMTAGDAYNYYTQN